MYISFIINDFFGTVVERDTRRVRGQVQNWIERWRDSAGRPWARIELREECRDWESEIKGWAVGTMEGASHILRYGDDEKRRKISVEVKKYTKSS